MSTPAPEPAGPHPDVRVAAAVISELRGMPRTAAAAAARAIQRVKPDAGTLLRLPALAHSKWDSKYLALPSDDPDDPDAPVVIYRPLNGDDEGSGYLVTALVSQDTYADYANAEETGLLDSPLVRVVTAVAAAAAVAAASAAVGTIAARR